MSGVDRPELLYELTDLGNQEQIAEERAAAFEAEARQLRSGWSDKRWAAMYTAARGLQQAWEADEIGLEEALTVSNELTWLQRWRNHDGRCNVVAAAAVIAAMQTGEPVVGASDLQQTGITAAPAKLVLSAHPRQEGVANPSVLYRNLHVVTHRIIPGSETIATDTTETKHELKGIEDRYTVGSENIQSLLDGLRHEVKRKPDNCGGHHGGRRVSNTPELIQMLKVSKAFRTAGIKFNTESLDREIDKGREVDYAYVLSRRSRDRSSRIIG